MGNAALRCPACGAATSVAFSTRDRNRRHGDSRFEYRKCSVCGLIYLADPPADLAPYYGDQYYGVPSLEAIEHAASVDSYQVSFVTDQVQGGRLVEVGPAWGVFSLQAKLAGFDVTGVEMDARCCEFLRTTIGVGAVCTDHPEDALSELPPSRAIAMWHSLEHVRDPWACLANAAANLEPGGILLVATPNPRALGFRLTRGQWPHVDAPRHLWLFPPSVLEDRLRAHGVRLEHITARDPGARHWNRFAWQHWLTNLLPADAVRSRRAADRVGGWITSAASALETRGLNGSAYTAIFRKES